jgi:hypothetical protein
MATQKTKGGATVRSMPKRGPLPGRDALGHWLPGYSGCPPEKRKLVPGHPWRWQPGVSGNPAGTSKLRAEFEQEFYRCLIGHGDPAEAAALLWKAARAGEAWGVQMLLDRLAPKESKFKLEVSRDEGFDYTKLTDEQLRQLESILEAVQPLAIEGGEGAPQPT